MPFQDSFLALTDTGSLRPVHVTVGVRFFRVGQHLAHVPLLIWPLYSRINSPSRLSFYFSLVQFVSQQVFLSSLAMWANPSLASYPLLFPYADGVVCLLVPALRRTWQLRVIWRYRLRVVCLGSASSLPMLRDCLNRIGNATNNFVNVFNTLLINLLISLKNKNAISIHFI